MPIGMPRLEARRIRTAEPTMPLAIPPPLSPVGFGIWVKKSRLIELAPILTMWTKIRMSGMSTVRVAVAISRVIPAFFVFRQTRNVISFLPPSHRG